MAKYTQEQRDTINYLINAGKVVHKRIGEAKSKDEIDKNKAKLKDIKDELYYMLNAEALFNAHMAAANKHADAAEAILRKCGLR